MKLNIEKYYNHMKKKKRREKKQKNNQNRNQSNYYNHRKYLLIRQNIKINKYNINIISYNNKNNNQLNFKIKYLITLKQNNKIYCQNKMFTLENQIENRYSKIKYELKIK